MNAKHTPGPLFVRQPESLPFDIQIVDAKEDVVFCESRHAYSTKQETVEDVMQGYGFPLDLRDAAIAANERQLADMNLRAAAPDLLKALKDCVAVMDRELAGLKVIQPELSAARAAIAKATGEPQ